MLDGCPSDEGRMDTSKISFQRKCTSAHTGKTNLDLAALNGHDRTPVENPCMRLIFCREHSRVVSAAVEFQDLAIAGDAELVGRDILG